MAEVFEIEEVPKAGNSSSSGNSNVGEKEQKPASNDKHIPNFEFGGYPNVPEGEFSPRIVDETW
jgi:hypothetical protein